MTYLEKHELERKEQIKKAIAIAFQEKIHGVDPMDGMTITNRGRKAHWRSHYLK